jgi:hypothetical protein
VNSHIFRHNELGQRRVHNVHPVTTAVVLVVTVSLALGPLVLLGMVAYYGHKMNSPFVLSVVVVGIVTSVFGIAGAARGLKPVVTQLWNWANRPDLNPVDITDKKTSASA